MPRPTATKHTCSTQVTARDDGALSSDERIYLTGENSVQRTYREQRQPRLAVYVSDEPITEPHRRDALRLQVSALVTPKVHELRRADHGDQEFIGAAVWAGWRRQTVRTPAIGAGNKRHSVMAPPRREGSLMGMAMTQLRYVCRVTSLGIRARTASYGAMYRGGNSTIRARINIQT